MSNVKPFMSLTMGKEKKKRQKRRLPEEVVYGCRVFPLRVALLREKILSLPTIYWIAPDADLEMILKRRKRLIAELIKEEY